MTPPRKEIPEKLSFRPLDRADFPMLQRWLSVPHVNEWWREPLDLSGVREKYGRRVDGEEPTYVFVIEYETRPIGWIQWYRWADYPQHAAQLGAAANTAGIDLAIAEVDMVGRGLGARAIREFSERIIFSDPNISAVVADPEANNARSLRAFQKSGFILTQSVQLQGESCQRQVVRLERTKVI